MGDNLTYHLGLSNTMFLAKACGLVNIAMRCSVDNFLYNHMWNEVKFPTHRIMDSIFREVIGELELKTR